MIAGFPGYEVSNQGRIRNHRRLLSGYIEMQNGRPRSIATNLVKDGKRHRVRFHRLVLEAFVGPCPKGMEGCHNDGNPLNNCVGNLRWDTRLANQHDSIKHGTHSKPPSHHGENHPRVTISDEDVAAIRRLPYVRGLFSEIAREHGVAPITIRRLYYKQSRATS